MKRVVLFAMSTLFAVALLSEAEQTSEAKIYSKAQFIRFKKGVPIYGGSDGDRVPASFHSVPKEFHDRRIELRKVGSTAPVKFKVKKAGIVTLVTTRRGAKILIQQGWVEVGKGSMMSLHDDVRELPILQKKLDVGVYSIPSAGASGTRLLKK